MREENDGFFGVRRRLALFYGRSRGPRMRGIIPRPDGRLSTPSF